jgi:hypothetical protein
MTQEWRAGSKPAAGREPLGRPSTPSSTTSQAAPRLRAELGAAAGDDLGGLALLAGEQVAPDAAAAPLRVDAAPEWARSSVTSPGRTWVSAEGAGDAVRRRAATTVSRSRSIQSGRARPPGRRGQVLGAVVGLDQDLGEAVPLRHEVGVERPPGERRVAGAWVTNDDPPAGPGPAAKGFRAGIGPRRRDGRHLGAHNDPMHGQPISPIGPPVPPGRRARDGRVGLPRRPDARSAGASRRGLARLAAGGHSDTAWLLGCLVLWWVFLPLYLTARRAP